jgi:hypothetical protein
VHAGAGVALRSMARAPLRRVAVTVAYGIPLRGLRESQVPCALLPRRATPTPARNLLDSCPTSVRPGASPDDAEGSASEPQLGG